MTPSRRALLAGGAGFALALAWQPARATNPALQEALRRFAGNSAVRPGRVTLDIAPLVENGNVVPVSVRVESPMSAADHVQAIAIFAELNPLADVAQFNFSPRSGRAKVDTRIRLHTSQQVLALARMSDGSVWSHTVDVLVTLAACIE